MSRHPTLLICGIFLLAACTEDPPPRSVNEFVDNPIMLEAAMVRCGQDRSKTKYDAECLNARAAVKRIEAKEEADRKAELEARSERKRQALRRTQQAAANARRRAAESERQREEAEYLAQFGATPPDGETYDEDTNSANLPGAVLPATNLNNEGLTPPIDDMPPATDGGNAPEMTAEPVEEPPPGDLESIRDELRRRSEEDEGS